MRSPSTLSSSATKAAHGRSDDTLRLPCVRDQRRRLRPLRKRRGPGLQGVRLAMSKLDAIAIVVLSALAGWATYKVVKIYLADLIR